MKELKQSCEKLLQTMENTREFVSRTAHTVVLLNFIFKQLAEFPKAMDVQPGASGMVTVGDMDNAIANINAKIDFAERLKDKAEENHREYKEMMRALTTNYDIVVSRTQANLKTQVATLELIKLRDRLKERTKRAMRDADEKIHALQKTLRDHPSPVHRISTERSLKAAYESITRALSDANNDFESGMRSSGAKAAFVDMCA